MIRVLAVSACVLVVGVADGRLSELGGEAGVRLIGVPEARDSRGVTRTEASDISARSLSRHPAHFGVPGTWFTRHAADSDKTRILRLRIRHAADVERFFTNHVRLSHSQAGRDALWQHRRMGRWARAALREVLWRPPLLAGEREWHASLKNPTNRLLLRLARCETGYLRGGRVNWKHSNSQYVGGLGFTWGTYRQFRVYVKPLPPLDGARATMLQQLAIGRELVRRFRFTPWPSCHRRLGIY